MKCHFCNWDNPEGKTNCEKCGHLLQAESAEIRPHVHEHPTTRQPSKGAAELKATVRENCISRPGAAVSESKAECPECGYSLENGICPSCGYDENKQELANQHLDMNNEGKKTVRPIRKGEKEGRFVLTPISEETGLSEGEILPFEGNEVLLKRDNTDPKNQTITSQGQAVISHEEGKWLIEDKSEYRTTFVQAARKTELQSGDLILLGNQLYRFDSLEQ